MADTIRLLGPTQRAHDVYYPWAGETPRKPAPDCNLTDLLRAYADVQNRFDRNMAAFREADDHG